MSSAGADGFIRDLTDGYETLLGPEFEGGHNLSIGQWPAHRAGAGGAARCAADHPGRADRSPGRAAEHQLFESMRSLFRDRTILLISHRFSSVRTADRIYVLSKGRLVEQGPTRR